MAAATGVRVWLAVLPHPSGINHWYNSTENRVAASLFLQAEIRSRGGPPLDDKAMRSAEVVRVSEEDVATTRVGRREF